MNRDNGGRWRHRTSRPIRRRAVLASVAGMVGFAGCSGDGNGGTDDEGTDDSDGEETTNPDGADEETTTTSGNDFSIESRCQVELTPSEVAVASCQSEADQGGLLVTTVVRNESQQTVNVFDYRYRVRVFDEDEAVVQESISALEYDITANRNTQFPEGRDVEPGETLPVTHRIGLDESNTPEDVEFYTITIRGR